MTNDTNDRTRLIWDIATVIRAERVLTWSECIQMAVSFYYTISEDYQKYENGVLEELNQNLIKQPPVYL